jgi:hypothetical protein
MDDTFKVEGVDYTPEGIRLLREDCILVRNESMGQWPEAVPFTVMMSHVIAHLANYATIVESIQGADKAVRDAGFLHMGRKNLARVDDISPEAVNDRLDYEEVKHRPDITRAEQEATLDKAYTEADRAWDAAQFGENGICRWCGALPNGEHAPDCHPPVYTEAP